MYKCITRKLHKTQWMEGYELFLEGSSYQDTFTNGTRYFTIDQ